MKTIQGAWKYPDGSPAANAKVYFQLSAAARVTGTNITAPTAVSTQLDSSGSIPAGFKIYANDELSPNNLVYVVSVVSPGGAPVYGSQFYSIAGASPINLSNFVPTLIS